MNKDTPSTPMIRSDPVEKEEGQVEENNNIPASEVVHSGAQAYPSPFPGLLSGPALWGPVAGIYPDGGEDGFVNEHERHLPFNPGMSPSYEVPSSMPVDPEPLEGVNRELEEKKREIGTPADLPTEAHVEDTPSEPPLPDPRRQEEEGEWKDGPHENEEAEERRNSYSDPDEEYTDRYEEEEEERGNPREQPRGEEKDKRGEFRHRSRRPHQIEETRHESHNYEEEEEEEVSNRDRASKDEKKVHRDGDHRRTSTVPLSHFKKHSSTTRQEVEEEKRRGNTKRREREEEEEERDEEEEEGEEGKEYEEDEMEERDLEELDVKFDEERTKQLILEEEHDRLDVQLRAYWRIGYRWPKTFKLKRANTTAKRTQLFRAQTWLKRRRMEETAKNGTSLLSSVLSIIGSQFKGDNFEIDLPIEPSQMQRLIQTWEDKNTGFGSVWQDPLFDLLSGWVKKPVDDLKLSMAKSLASVTARKIQSHIEKGRSHRTRVPLPDSLLQCAARKSASSSSSSTSSTSSTSLPAARGAEKKEPNGNPDSSSDDSSSSSDDEEEEEEEKKKNDKKIDRSSHPSTLLSSPSSSSLPYPWPHPSLPRSIPSTPGPFYLPRSPPLPSLYSPHSTISDFSSRQRYGSPPSHVSFKPQERAFGYPHSPEQGWAPANWRGWQHANRHSSYHAVGERKSPHISGRPLSQKELENRVSESTRRLQDQPFMRSPFH